MDAMRVDAYASLAHYAEHLWPIWQALPAACRGRFYSVGRDTDWWGEELPRRWPDPTRPMLVAAYSDAVKVRPRPLVYVEHGAGQTYIDAADHPAYSGGADLGDVVLFLCPSEAVAERWRARYPGAGCAVVGCPKLDRWHRVTAPRQYDDRVTVAVTFHWDCSLVPETRSAWSHYDEALEQLVASAARRGWRVLGHGHPRLWGRIVRRWRQLGVDHTPQFADVLDQADVLVADNTSAMWEFASTDRPLVVLDTPWYRRDVEHGLRFWTHADAGVRIGQGEHLVEAVAWALDDPGDLRQNRQRASREVYAHTDGLAAQRAADAIVKLLEEPMPDPFAPRRRRSSNETRSDVDVLADRLKTLAGLSDEEVAEFKASWADARAEGVVGTDELARLHELVKLDDDTLRRMIAAERGDDPDELSEGASVPDDASGQTVMGVTDLGGTEGDGGFDREQQVDAIYGEAPVAPAAAPDAGEGSSAAPDGDEGAAGVTEAEEGRPDVAGPLAREALARVRGGTNVRDLLAWVGDDRERAMAMEWAEDLQAHREQRDPRKTLLDGVAKVTGG